MNIRFKKNHERRWIFADLDNTLHSFTHASSAALDAVCVHLQTLAPQLVRDELIAVYRAIIDTQAAAFIDGRNSRAYRAERIQAMLIMSALSMEHLDMLLDLFAATLHENLRCFDGVIETLQCMRDQGYSIAIVSEGVHDNQERTVDALGLRRYIEFLMTANREGVSKPDGLFERALQRADALPSHVVVIGDSYDRDIRPALALGMRAIEFHPGGTCVSKHAHPCFTAFPPPL